MPGVSPTSMRAGSTLPEHAVLVSSGDTEAIHMPRSNPENGLFTSSMFLGETHAARLRATQEQRATHSTNGLVRQQHRRSTSRSRSQSQSYARGRGYGISRGRRIAGNAAKTRRHRTARASDGPYGRGPSAGEMQAILGGGRRRHAHSSHTGSPTRAAENRVMNGGPGGGIMQGTWGSAGDASAAAASGLRLSPQ